ncbi:MAG: hypothetical protein V7675_17735 [Hyphomonas sp.]|uniref:hypothetical protein n=1 Tax=Hyphomonas sp. TaxID=87 RepID=UPI003002E652
MENALSADANELSYLQGQELSDEAANAYGLDAKKRSRYRTSGKPGEWNEDGELVNSIRCAKSGLPFNLVRVRDVTRPSGLRITRIEQTFRPKMSEAVKNEIRLLGEIGIVLTEDEVRSSLGSAYAKRRTLSIPHLPVSHQNFNDRALAESHVAGAISELVGQENIAWVTQLFDAKPHQCPGTTQHCPRQLLHRFYQQISVCFPNEYALIIGFTENVLRQTCSSGTSKSSLFFRDKNHGKGRKILKRNQRKVQGKIGSGVTKSYAEDEGDFTETILTEVPHIHYLIAVFDVNGEPHSFNNIRNRLRGKKSARHEYRIEKLKLADSAKRGVKDAMKDASNVIVQAATCIRYSMKRSASSISDRDLLHRALFRGASPNHGFVDCVIIGKDISSPRIQSNSIPNHSRLRLVLDERKRVSTLARLDCANDGEPETIEQLHARLHNTLTPFHRVDGRIVRSLVYKSSNTILHSLKSFWRTMITRGNGVTSYCITRLGSAARWLKLPMGSGP